MSDNAFERILNRLNESDTAVSVKTASEATPPSAEARMLETVRRVSDAATKTAAVAAPAATTGPAADLARMAKEAADAEQEIMLKEAQAMGAALADGFMERFAQYDVALSQAGIKTASAVPDHTVKQAAEAGYQRAIQDMEKHAQAEFQRGYEETMAAVHKTAAEIHYAGQAMAHNIIERLATEKR